MEKKIEELEKNTAALLEHFTVVNHTISGGFEKVNNNFEKITAHLQRIDKEIKLLHAKIDALDNSTATEFGGVSVKLDDLKIEITKINDVTSYDELYRNMSGFRKPDAKA